MGFVISLFDFIGVLYYISLDTFTPVHIFAG